MLYFFYFINGTFFLKESLHIQNMNIQMDKLIRQFADNRLTSQELPAFKEELQHTADHQLEEYLQQEWMSPEADDIRKVCPHLSEMKQAIDSRLGFGGTSNTVSPTLHPKIGTVLMKWFSIASAILLPLMVIATYYFYHERQVEANKEVTFVTGKGEKASIVLPDGSKVTLNHDSRLFYLPSLFGRDARQVSFEGEAYFDVAKDKESPFIICQEKLQIEVLGTKFCLRARPQEASAQLLLDEGLVRMTATRTQNHQVVNPGEMAELNYATGQITVFPQSESADLSAWKQNEMDFLNASFRQVVKSIEDYYDVRVIFHAPTRLDHFTGTLPTRDLEQAIHILQLVYGFHYKVQDHHIFITF